MQRVLNLMREAGARPAHEKRLLRAWLAGRALRSATTARDLQFPRTLLEALPAIESHLNAHVRIESEHPGSDGSLRFLLALHDQKTVESVLLPRDGLCISSQVGCAVGCVFCMTGRAGLLRQLTSAEMVAQVAAGRRHRPVRRVVFMGMGEPSHNLTNVLEAITVLGTHGDIGHKNLVFSTVGDPRLFERLLANPVKPALAISLHTTDVALRAQLVPRGPRFEPAELIALADDYGNAVGYPVMYQWTLIEGVNDTDAELERLTELMQGRYGIVNLIPYNTVEDLPYKRPPTERARKMSQHLHQHGVLCKLRRSAGQDVEGACGQLRARSLPERAAIATDA
ncbi:MAG: RNA methyltransferase [Planctomycetes bacterium]|nr:RNA methyltransferase [Planctomycetota bacterium]